VNGTTWYYPREDFNCTYPVGVDPVWGLTSNRLTFVNNIKMKLAVIFGVLHMTMGVIIKGTNEVYFKRWPGFFFEVVAGIIILEGLFGWMDLLIFAKWFFQPDFYDNTPVDDLQRNATYWNILPNGTNSTTVTYAQIYFGDYINEHAPGVINILINGVFGGGAPPPGTGTEFAYVGSGGVRTYPNGTTEALGYFNGTAAECAHGVATIQNCQPNKNKQDSMYGWGLALLFCVMACIPLMLFVKPCCCRGSSKKIAEAVQNNVIELSGHSKDSEQPLAPNHMGSLNPNSRGGSFQEEDTNEGVFRQIYKILRAMRPHDHGNSFGEMMIHQMIETIEFVLGTVSNTASYLRLWALSLAHGQLAEVFFNLIFTYCLKTDSMALSVVLGAILWPAFWTVTFAVLMLMDCLECFLHTLRLHWVEFQNKFFKGEGYHFNPFKYHSILKGVLG
jgi:V-type H+-transporting ATPase subunit a